MTPYFNALDKNFCDKDTASSEALRKTRLIFRFQLICPTIKDSQIPWDDQKIKVVIKITRDEKSIEHIKNLIYSNHIGTFLEPQVTESDFHIFEEIAHAQYPLRLKPLESEMKSQRIK